jgi:hypothetical protein
MYVVLNESREIKLQQLLLDNDELSNQNHHNEMKMFVMSGASLPIGKVPFWDLQIEQVNEETQEKEVVHYAHRCILACRCSVFNTMFRNSMREAETGIVLMPDDGSIVATKCFLHYIYADSVPSPKSSVTHVDDVKYVDDVNDVNDVDDVNNVQGESKKMMPGSTSTQTSSGLGLNEDNITDVYVLARRYMLKRLREICGRKILNIFDMEDVDSVIGLWIWSLQISDDRIEEAAGWYLSLNFSTREVKESIDEFGLNKEQRCLLAKSAQIPLKTIQNW